MPRAKKSDIRATTILGEQGDVTIVWTEEEDDKMLAIIEKKMKAGVSFFIIEPRFFGLLPAKKTLVTNIEQARQHRAIAIKDNDFAAFVESGSGDVSKTPDEPARTVRRASTAKEAASAQTVGVKQMQGG